MKSKFLFKIKSMVAIVLGIGLFGTVSAADYCVPFTDNYYDYIEVFETFDGETNISNVSGQDLGGYGDYYTTHSVSAYAGNDFDFKISFGSMFDSYGSRIWIDWGNDGTFDASDVVFMSSVYMTDFQGGTITVPAGTPAGDYRMRISISYLGSSGFSDPCEDLGSWGEFEDYKLTVLADDDNGDDENEYCVPEVDASDGDYIENFTTSGGVTNINNTSGNNGGYGDFYNTHSVSAYAGDDIGIVINFSNDDWDFGARAWVDWDQDGEFDPIEEVVYTSDWWEYELQEGTITIPAGTPAGDYRLRINMSFTSGSGLLNPCPEEDPFWGYDDYGEFEDYKLTVLEDDEPGETCGWRIRIWGNNATGITWELKDGKGNVADESPEGGWASKSISHLTDTFDLEGPVTFTLNANTSGDYQSVNYYLLRDGAKIEHGRTRDSIVIHERDCSDDGGAAAARPGMNASLSGFDFSYHPNPVKDVLYINSVQDVKEVKVFNIAGQQLINLNKGLSSNSEINVSTLPEGVYVIRAVLEDGQIETFKVVKK